MLLQGNHQDGLRRCPVQAAIPALGKWQQGDQHFKASASYIDDSRPAWDIKDSVKKKKRKSPGR